MCKCTPGTRTPFCGKPGCEWPKADPATPDVKETKAVFVVWTNTDLTEGRGYQIPINACWSRTTARRLAKKQGVMGSDATVQEHSACLIGGYWYAPCQIIEPSKGDEAQDKADAIKAQAIERARAAGLSDADIDALRS